MKYKNVQDLFKNVDILPTRKKQLAERRLLDDLNELVQALVRDGLVVD